MNTPGTETLTSIGQVNAFELDIRMIDGPRYLLDRLLSCWHLKLSRPFTRGKETYRVCTRCGMRREFDLEKWKATGRFYQAPLERSANG